MIDAHCHIDMYKNPHSVAEESERLGIITIGMTLLPSHFELGYEHVKQYKKVRLALGMHPLKSELHKSEFSKFLFYLDHTSYIGEIGLDFSKEGINQKDLQIESFKKILSSISGKPKIISLHSRKAEKEELQSLIENDISNAIFHWYSGPLTLIDEIVKYGYYFSINPAMIKTENGKKIIERIPKNLLLTETDGPYISIKGNFVKPKDVELVEEFLAKKWNFTLNKVDDQIHKNFSSLVKNIL
ncbi:MAG TPA: TatD family deoxyribonuclease [Bacteroidetes bacterium]|nr:TatD family deoxyribonuclease [Bacteroidota bacterium]